MRRALLAALAFSVLGSGTARAQLTVASTFNPSDTGSLCGLAFDPVTGSIWVHGCSAADVQRYTPAGTYVSEVVRPGESANDVDIEFAPEALALNSTALPVGSLLYINGEIGPAEIYASDKTSGTVLATLATAFGASHVVGGAYHPSRNTFFLIQDMVPAALDENRIAEIDPSTGSVLDSFQITATFPVNFGDLDVCKVTGNLLVASSDETRLAEYTPTGAFVAYHDLPAGVTSPSGLGIDDAGGDIWVANTVGNVWRLTGGPCNPASGIPAFSGIAKLLFGALILGASLLARKHATS